MVSKQSLEGKTALITGSSKGIGKSIALAFAREGVEVIIVSHGNPKEGLSVLEEIEKENGKGKYFNADLSNEKGVTKLFDEIARHYSQIDILVNNVGHSFSTNFEDIAEDTLLRDLRCNFIATVLCSKRVRAFMPKGGHIINTSSIRGIDYSGRIPLIGYCAGKAAVNSFTKNLAMEYAPDIFVNAVAPGFVWTEALSKSGEELISKWKKTIPIGRFIMPDELAEVYVQIAKSSIFTGSVIVADGGYTVLEK